MAEAFQLGGAPRRLGPLEGISLPADADFKISVLPPAARLILRGGSEVREAASAAFKVALPVGPNRAATVDKSTRAAIWLGPDEWLLMAPGEAPAELRAALSGAMSKNQHSLTDISHRQIGLELVGRLAARLLSAGCPLDLRRTAFPPSMATRTIFLKTEIILWRQAEERFHVDVWRSFAPYFVGHLAEAIAGATGI
jgi:sarcosine oxidase, subunit gamma